MESIFSLIPAVGAVMLSASLSKSKSSCGSGHGKCDSKKRKECDASKCHPKSGKERCRSKSRSRSKSLSRERKCDRDHKKPHCETKSHCEEKKKISKVQILEMQDFEGRIFGQPLQAAYYTAGLAQGTLLTTDQNRPVGGLAVLKSYFDAERAANPNTLFFLGAENVCSSNRSLYRTVNSYHYYEPTHRALQKLGLNARSLAFHDFSDADIERQKQLIQSDLKHHVAVVGLGIRDPAKDLKGLKTYEIFEVDGVKVMYTAFPDPRTSIGNSFAYDTNLYPGMKTFWGSGPVTVENDPLLMVQAANAARAAAAAEGAQVFILNAGRGFTSGGTGATVLANIEGYDVIFFDNAAQTFAGFRPDKNNKLVLVMAPWSQGEEYARFSFIYDHEQKKITEFRGKGDSPIPIVQSASQVDASVMRKVLVTAFADTVVPDLKMQHLLNKFDASAHEHLDRKLTVLTRNMTLDQAVSHNPSSDNAVWLNMVADAARAKFKTQLALIGNIVHPQVPRKVVQYFQPLNSNLSRTLAPFDLVAGDVWDSLYNEVATNFVFTHPAVKVSDIFAALEQSISQYIVSQTDFRNIVGFSGLTFVYNPANPFGLRVTGAMIAGVPYTRNPDGSVANGQNTVSVASIGAFQPASSTTGLAVYPGLASYDWKSQGYGSAFAAMEEFLATLPAFDPDQPQWKNRWTV